MVRKLGKGGREVGEKGEGSGGEGGMPTPLSTPSLLVDSTYCQALFSPEKKKIECCLLQF